MAGRCTWTLGLLFLAQTGWAQTITVEYRDKPPYTYSQNGKPAGFLMQRLIAILQQADIRATYSEIPAKRIIHDLQDDKLAICSPGWYKIPEREAFARFSRPIHQDKPHIVVANRQVADQLRAFKSLKRLLADPDFKLGKVFGVSYGPVLDAMIASANQAVTDSVVTPDGLAHMVAQHRADYMLMDQEDYQYLRQANLLDSDKIATLTYPDMPPGLKRYILCSRHVSPATMRRIDAAIQTMQSE
ncbi:substrate-binding periplasmic protein [Paludibacterium purpuratum]|uniref:Uncharacterized protein (TIGR02285 family) n=1 Tax=Paludibacterium purpuratum TaxID=1144873 RepID=A0A4R7BAM9_9NEIS|nr:transporter substrate-binding domain-containing protein [Paludibacterium purpuratum]TDR80707.1 uncharacterized protein (TIGR02285 family) [Paludibacterium purpuratum]